MIGSELAICKTIIDIFALEDIYDESQVLSQVAQLISDLTEDEADFFGLAYARATHVLATDLPRWRAAIDIATRLDIYEVVQTLTNDVEKSFDTHLIASLMSLRENPGVDSKTYEHASAVLSQHELASSIDAVLKPRLSSSFTPSSDLQAAISIQMWPGRYSLQHLARVSPLIYIGEAGAAKRDVLRVAAELSILGARVRRIPRDWKKDPHPGWLSSDLPIVTWSGVTAGQVRRVRHDPRVNAVGAPANLDSTVSVARLIARVNDALPGALQLHATASWATEGMQPFAPETLKLGAFDSSEMAYLGAASRGVVQRVAKQALPPIGADVHRWRFDQLLALRVFQAFKLTGRPFRGEIRTIQAHLMDAASASAQTRVAIDSNGTVYAESDGVFRSIHTNQEALDGVLMMDDVFKPIQLGGSTVPDLLNPSRFTSVHPAILAGTPTIARRRVSVRALAHMQLSNGREAVRSAYPELSAIEISDGVSIGAKINA